MAKDKDKEKPKKHRGHNQGTIYEYEKGKWIAQITVGRDPITHKPKRRSIYGKSQPEVAAKMNEIIYGVSKGIYTNPSKYFVSDWLDVWSEEYCKPRIKANTWRGYETIIRNHLKPELGGIKLTQLNTHHIQKFYNKLAVTKRKDGSEGNLTATAVKAHAILSKCLKEACKHKLIIVNPADNTDKPKVDRIETETMSKEEMSIFLEKIKEYRYYAGYLLSLGTGVRPGEVLALHWKDVNLKLGTIKITCNVVRVLNSDPKIKTKTVLIIQNKPKTKKSVRTIYLPDLLLDALKDHRKKQLKEIAAAGEIYDKKSNLVFSTPEGHLIEPRNFFRSYKACLKKCKIDDKKLYALRHTCATRLLEKGQDMKVVQDMFGHEEIGTTYKYYSHVTPELKKEAAKVINEFLK